MQSSISEADLAKKIVELHDTLGNSFRQISQALNLQGFKMNKDKANQLYAKYKGDDYFNSSRDPELEQLKKADLEATEKLNKMEEKEKTRTSLTLKKAEIATFSFKQRQRLFADPKKLLNFAKRTMPTINPVLWDSFLYFCLVKDPAKVIQDVIGDQDEYEEQLTLHLDVKLTFYSYLQDRLKDYLSEQARF